MPAFDHDANGVPRHDLDTGLRTEAKTDILLKHVFSEFIRADYRTDERARKVGIDFVLKGHGIGLNGKCAVDDKADTYLGTEPYRKNLALEVGSFSRRGWRDGWFFYGRPAALRYVSVASKDCFVVPLNEVRAYLSSRMSDFKIGAAPNFDTKSGTEPPPFTHITLNLLVPWPDILTGCPGASVVRLGEGTSLLEGTAFESRLASPREALQRVPCHVSTQIPGPTENYLRSAVLRCNRLRDMAEYFKRCRLPPNLVLPL